MNGAQRTGPRAEKPPEQESGSEGNRKQKKQPVSQRLAVDKCGEQILKHPDGTWTGGEDETENHDPRKRQEAHRLRRTPTVKTETGHHEKNQQGTHPPSDRIPDQRFQLKLRQGIVVELGRREAGLSQEGNHVFTSGGRLKM